MAGNSAVATSVGTSNPSFRSTWYFWPKIRFFLVQGPEGLSHFLGQGLEELANLGSGRVQNGIESLGFSGQGLEKYGVEPKNPKMEPYFPVKPCS